MVLDNKGIMPNDEMALHRGTAWREGAVSQNKGGFSGDWHQTGWGKEATDPAGGKAVQKERNQQRCVNYSWLNRLFFV